MFLKFSLETLLVPGMPVFDKASFNWLVCFSTCSECMCMNLLVFYTGARGVQHDTRIDGMNIAGCPDT